MPDNIAKDDLNLILEVYKSQTESNYALLEQIKLISLKVDQVLESIKSSCVIEKIEQINNLLNQLSDLRHVIAESCKESEISISRVISDHNDMALQSFNMIEMNFIKLQHVIILQYTVLGALVTNFLVPFIKSIFNAGY
jgi:hypothetical protein